jgi:hypothetical protein
VPVPIWSRTGEFAGPASNISPEMSTPLTFATAIGTAPCSAVSVAMPIPSAIVSGRRTLMVRPTSHHQLLESQPERVIREYAHLSNGAFGGHNATGT